MAHLIILQGPSQSGKTLTIKKVLYQLHEREPELEYRGKKWVECLEIIKLSDVKIGVSSRSDKFPELKKNLHFLIFEKKCQIGIIAINESMKGVKELLQEMIDQNITITRIQKYPIFCSRESKEHQNELNIKASIKIISKFDELFETLVDLKTEKIHDYR